MLKQKSLNIPNILSLLRIVLIPIFVLLFYLHVPGKHLFCALIFAFAALTDWLDGYLARKWNQLSRFGAFIDPVADKLIVAIALILLVQQESSIFMTLPALIIVGREIVVSALREWMSELGKRTHLAVVTVAKYKTGLQMIAIFLLLLANPDSGTAFRQIISLLGFVCLYLAAGLTMWSMIIYLQIAWRDLWE